MKKFIKKHWSNILFIVFLALLIIPQTRMPIQVFVQRIISFSPSETSEDEREVLQDYHWPLSTMEGEEVNFAVSRERVAVVNMWATWCPPCVAEMPSFQKLYDDYKNDVDFYFVTSEEVDRVERFMTKNGYDMSIYLQQYQAPEQMRSTLLPTTYVLSRNCC
jgi:thiol-disulfide isomerase/thioredoxin